MKLKTLSLTTVILFVISLFVFMNENKRGTDLLAGSDYIKGLDINKIQKIRLSFGKDKNITLTRDSNRFLLENYKSYPASTEKVNDLIYKLASIQVKEKVASNASEKELSKYELDKEKRKYLVELFDNDGKKTIAFRVGKSLKGKGNYLFKEGKSDVYVSKDSLWLDSSYKDFVNTVLLEVKKEEIEKISVMADKNFEIIKKDESFIIDSEEIKKSNKDKLQDIPGNFSSIKFKEFFTPVDKKVKELHFDKNIKIKLKNKLVYSLSFAKNDQEHFLKLSALFEEPQTQFVVGQNDGKEELQKIEDTILAQEKAQRTNLEKGAWVYKVDKSVYDKIALDSKKIL
jgi:hypothetical protein